MNFDFCELPLEFVSSNLLYVGLNSVDTLWCVCCVRSRNQIYYLSLVIAIFWGCKIIDDEIFVFKLFSFRWSAHHTTENPFSLRQNESLIKTNKNYQIKNDVQELNEMILIQFFNRSSFDDFLMVEKFMSICIWIIRALMHLNIWCPWMGQVLSENTSQCTRDIA